MKQRLINHIQSIQDPALRRACLAILVREKFFEWPASLSHHHAYEGGLLAHTVEVCDIALGVAGLNISGKLDGAPWEEVLFPKVNRDVLLAAALWHDVMKVNEYHLSLLGIDYYPEGTRCLAANPCMWIKNETRTKMFGHHEHIIASAMAFQKTAWLEEVNPTTIDAVTHCILAHHGRKEWGSPVEPQTIEALILHQADMLSSRFGKTKEVAP